MSRYRFALRPAWLLSHLFVLALIAAMATAGFWQVDRLDEKRERNATVIARTDVEAAEVPEILDGPDAPTEGLEYRTAIARGTYGADQVLIANRSMGGAPGAWVVTPLILDDGGDVILVNRGFIYTAGGLDAVPDEHAPPEGEVVVRGLLRDGQQRGSGPSESTDRATNLPRLDIPRIAAGSDRSVLPMYLSLEGQDPAVTSTDPTPVPREELDEGPHFGYAVQWFIFTSIAIGGYPLILRRKARELQRSSAAAAAEGDPGSRGEVEPAD